MHLPGIVLALSLGCRGALAPIDPINPDAAPAVGIGSLETRAALAHTLLGESTQLQSELAAFRESGGWRGRGYFDATESDHMEALLFRFGVLYASFFEAFDAQGGPGLLLTEQAERPRAHLLALHAGLSLADASAFLVSEFAHDEIATAKLNEEFPRSNIPRGTYARLQLAVGSSRRRDGIEAAWQLHEQEVARPDSHLVRLVRDAPAFARLLDDLPPLHARVSERFDRATGGAFDRARHSRVADLGRETVQSLGDAGYASRKLVFTDVSRLRLPRAHVIRFSPEQKREVRSRLRPGDLILTFTSGYMSNVFIPGVFKHGITYVGGSDERAAAGLTVEAVPSWARADPERLAEALARDALSDGRPADLIEAVAEGVKFSNLDEMLEIHVNRLLVLRPRLSDAELTAFVVEVFTFVGDPYDFRFDFADASMQVCTEVIWRALDGKGGIAFELTERAGNPTLSADDVAEYHLETRGERFEFVLLAEEDPNADDQRARIWLGTEGEARLAERMSGS